ncbi:DNA polymerase III subunit gamma/tau [Oceanirhabdus sp. W0125-5]|uniref:DNA polymerase III subunit gamma/tau n=1 Tax=Oceanirhabdus sp. W0125-5 TaxID=2999116 RepID=UPI0022F32021|nr:DNA polymerase III subunit gamma/tau [Oceanirhabdus sp. W0125-5]WBW97557.1 DNA polymerase III subunit gamma/tau [Oceanirhabdus sp. W0125-5]
MAYTALYREWRPRIFSDVVGQQHVTVTLKNQIKNNKIAHAYLLCGTRGTGKTSTAKVLAKAVNCLNSQDGEPCNECDMCKKINSGTAIDVTELDAASNNRVENIRELIDEVQYPPQEAKFKVYIIDEVHMLSIGAVNAFLKTLEEPPSYVIFILATTDPQKLPITILSRCQRFEFKRIKSQIIFKSLRKIIDEIGIYADDMSLKLIARICDGAMRDAQSILDQVISMSGDSVEYEKVIDILGFVTNDSMVRIIDRVIDKDIEGAIKEIDNIIENGKDIYIFIKDLIMHLRNVLISKISDNPEEILDLSRENIEIIKDQGTKIRVEEIMRYINILQEAEEQCKWSRQGRIFLELALIKLIKIEYDTSNEVILSRLNKLEEKINSGNITITNATVNKTNHNGNAAKVKKNVKEVINYSNIPVNTDSKITLDDIKKKWKSILDLFKARRKMVIYAALFTGKPIMCSNGVIEISYEKGFAFNKDRLEKDPAKSQVEQVFSEALNERVRIKYSIQEENGEEAIDAEQHLINTFGEDSIIIEE